MPSTAGIAPEMLMLQSARPMTCSRLQSDAREAAYVDVGLVPVGQGRRREQGELTLERQEGVLLLQQDILAPLQPNDPSPPLLRRQRDHEEREVEEENGRALHDHGSRPHPFLERHVVKGSAFLVHALLVMDYQHSAVA